MPPTAARSTARSPATQSPATACTRRVFGNKNVGTRTATASGLALAGSDKDNYNLTNTSANDDAEITVKTFSVSFQAQNKVWDGNATATIKSIPAPSLVGVVTGDNVTIGTAGATATFANANVGANKIVTGSGFTKSGADAGNYVFANPQGTTTASILAWNALGYGFYQPVGADAAHSIFTPAPASPPLAKPAGMEWNTIKGGQTVPLKFNIYAGTVEQKTLAAFGTTAFQTAQLGSCSDTINEDPVDFTTTGSTTLRYDGTQWIQNWQTPKSGGDTCFRTWVTFADGSTLEAFFKVKK